jgi:hypothetical protein
LEKHPYFGRNQEAVKDKFLWSLKVKRHIFIYFSDKHGCLSSVGKEFAGKELTVIVHQEN